MRIVLSGIFRVLSWVIYTCVIVILLLVVPAIALGYTPTVVLSGSMEPIYPVGSIVYYKSAAFEDIQSFDIIMFNFGSSSLAMHRVVEKDEENRCFTTKGDNNPSSDPNPVPYDKVVGKTLKYAVPYAGYLKKMIYNVPTIIIAAIILLIDMILKSEKENKKRKKIKDGEIILNWSKHYDPTKEI